jgi:hypothetical protein
MWQIICRRRVKTFLQCLISDKENNFPVIKVLCSGWWPSSHTLQLWICYSSTSGKKCTKRKCWGWGGRGKRRWRSSRRTGYFKENSYTWTGPSLHQWSNAVCNWFKLFQASRTTVYSWGLHSKRHYPQKVEISFFFLDLWKISQWDVRVYWKRVMCSVIAH